MNPYQMLSVGSYILYCGEQMIKLVPMVYLQLLFLGLWIVLFVYVKKLLKQKKRLIIALLCTLLCATGMLLAFKYAVEKRVYIKTIQNDSTLYSGPGKTFTALYHVPAGEKLIKLQTVGNFQKARWHGSIVWIETNNVTEIPHHSEAHHEF
jgi:hypothetical protein